MDSIYKVKQITKLYQSCDKCGLPKINCICNIISKVKTKAKIWILSTEKEFYRPSNTARILKLVNPESTEIYLWERTKKPEELIKNIEQDIYDVYLVFPEENRDIENTEVMHNHADKVPAFILLDGTWKEAKKILRRSDYLRGLPTISLNVDFKSEYNLRRGVLEGNLCTIEAAIEVIRNNNELENADKINKVFKMFLNGFKFGLYGQRVNTK
ncbi:tRNA-uridine aminocarboxypropyltransferase [Clostridium folliculivorans]|uniref:tRNA-uridine aminocarboxypropyltransferase n=1 Tax=Clostridium folliculivorans TaxID=2886038 RepID=A0A9W6DA11_9CLOT|nr:tRNA-uridine aminocarboxypropyltransferase [Clostridium folliculivorans]GKU24481.1 DTW domain-containing protein [Clostridium folliculivorans]GKU30579.1 DTW domain-containing protein [Clostridium folliculivorans]